MESKTCPDCGQSKPLSDFTTRGKRGGPAGYCRPCVARRLREMRAKRGARTRGPNSPEVPKGQTTTAEGMREYRRAWREKNLEQQRAYDRELKRRWYAERPEFRKVSRERQAAWRRANAAYLTEYERARRVTPERRAADKVKRLRRLNAPGPAPTADQIKARWDYFGGNCWMCGSQADQIDHVKPISKGGSKAASNMRPACGDCNSRKNAKWPFPTSNRR